MPRDLHVKSLLKSGPPGPDRTRQRRVCFVTGTRAEIGLMLRPERPRPIGGPGSTDAAFSGEVIETVYLGETVKYRIRLDPGFEVIVRWPFREAAQSLKVGDRTTVGWDRDDLHVVAWS